MTVWFEFEDVKTPFLLLSLVVCRRPTNGVDVRLRGVLLVMSQSSTSQTKLYNQSAFFWQHAALFQTEVLA